RVFDTTTALAQYGDARVRPYIVNGQLPFFDHLQEVAGNKPLAYETDLDLSGGSENTRYFISGAAKRDGAIINNTFNERQSLRVNLDQTLSSRWSLSVNTAFNRNQTDKGDRKSTRLNSSHQIISYAVFCLKKKKKNN